MSACSLWIRSLTCPPEREIPRHSARNGARSWTAQAARVSPAGHIALPRGQRSASLMIPRSSGWGDLAISMLCDGFRGDSRVGKGTFQWFSATSHATAWEVEKPFRATGTNALGMVSVQLGDPGEV